MKEIMTQSISLVKNTIIAYFHWAFFPSIYRVQSIDIEYRGQSIEHRVQSIEVKYRGLYSILDLYTLYSFSKIQSIEIEGKYRSLYFTSILYALSSIFYTLCLLSILYALYTLSSILYVYTLYSIYRRKKRPMEE